MAVLGGVEVFQLLPANSDTKLAGQVVMELAPVDVMTAVQYWLTHQVLKPGIQIEVIDVEQNHSTNVFKIKFNQVEPNP